MAKEQIQFLDEPQRAFGTVREVKPHPTKPIKFYEIFVFEPPYFEDPAEIALWKLEEDGDGHKLRIAVHANFCEGPCIASNLVEITLEGTIGNTIPFFTLADREPADLNEEEDEF